MRILHGRGFEVLVILMALPFCTPVPLLGLSTPFGLALMFFGIRIAFRKHPWLPRKILLRKIPYATLSPIINITRKLAQRLEKVLHPRLRFFHHWPSFGVINGLVITFSAFFLMLPLPIPFTNTLPALTIVLVSAGMMEEDGVAIISGYVTACATWAYFIFLFLAGKVGLEMIIDWFKR